MRKLLSSKWLVAVACGGTLMQMPGCTDTAIIVTSVSSVLTTGGLFYLIVRILE